jgi:hypothetical protein
MNSSLLVRFYLGEGPDHVGRLISEIHGFGFRQLERIHDYIQWLFPLVSQSGFNPHAPLLTEEDRLAFHRDQVIRKHFRVSLAMMLGFYGFREAEDGTIQRSDCWEDRRDNWLTRDNHNLLRITRILRSAMLCGFVPEACGFLDAVMKAAAQRPGVCGRSPEFWQDAVATVPGPPEP